MSEEQRNLQNWSGHLRPVMRQSRFKLTSNLTTVKEWAGSNASIATIRGSMQNILEPAAKITMQEESRNHKISSEVMKANLYKSVTQPHVCSYKFQISNTWPNNTKSVNIPSSWFQKYYQSLPSTPLVSGRTTPITSPNQNHSFRFLSRGTTPRCASPNRIDKKDGSFKGLASVLRPHPRFIKANEQFFDDSTNQENEFFL